MAHLEPDHTTVFRMNLSYLRQCLQLHDLLVYMVSSGSLSTRSYETAKRRQYNEGPTAASEFLVTEVMMRDPDPLSFWKFLEALEKSHQSSVARRLKSEYKKVTGKTIEEVVPQERLNQQYTVLGRDVERQVKAVPVSEDFQQVEPMEQETSYLHPVGDGSSYATPEGTSIEAIDMALAAGLKNTPKQPQMDPSQNYPTQQTPVLPIDIEPLNVEDLKIDRNNRLGQGNFGFVYQCHLRGTAVAVKEIGIPKKKNLEFNKSLINEVEVSAKVRHPNIVNFLGHTIEMQKSVCYVLLVYELIDGSNLDNIIGDEHLVKQYGFNLKKQYHILLQITHALAYLHSREPKIIHGDIKPANVMLNKRGEVKLCDLGLSKIKQSSTETMASTAAARGTPVYMAPEQLLRQRTSSTMTDMYAFGASMYEILFAEYMWDIEDVDGSDVLAKKMQVEKMPKRLEQVTDHSAYQIIYKCVQFEPNLRSDALSVAKELKRLLQTPVLPIDIEPLSLKDLKIDRNNCLGRGNFGFVYHCHLHGSDVAVKEIGIPKKKNLEFHKSLINEVEVSATVRHPNIVQFLGHTFDIQKNVCNLLLIYELINGSNLENIIGDEHLVKEYGFNLTKQYHILLQITQALAYLHSQEPKIIHGDIKPANVMLNKRGEVKLCDLGLSKIKKSSTRTMASTAATGGTPVYMAPEQLLRQRTSSTMTDMYAFGASMYEILFNEYMWDIEDTDGPDVLAEKMQVEKMPRRLQQVKNHPAYQIMYKCVQFEPDHRSDALTIVKELQRLYKNESEIGGNIE